MTDFNEELTLIKKAPKTDEKGNPVTDDIGNPVFVESCATVQCAVQSITRSEFWGSAQTNMQPEIVFIVYPYDYLDEQEIEFDGIRFSVIRHHMNDYERVELVCERKVKDIGD